jgi:aarF domain-containing kinase
LNLVLNAQEHPYFTSTTNTAVSIMLAASTAASARTLAAAACCKPFFTLGVRHYYHAPLPAPIHFVQRAQTVIARLYARRVLELAAAAAATHRLKVALCDDSNHQPAEWRDWERKDWADELLASLGTTHLQRFVGALARVTSLAVLALPLAVLVPIGYVVPPVKSLAWQYAIWGIEQAGPSYIKLTQWATTRQDLFSPEFCQYFGKLQDDTNGHGWAETERIMSEELGSLREFLELESDPIGSGCIAQVYRGRLTKACGKYPAGTDLAIKVQHPGIWYKVCVDFYIMGKVAKFLEELPALNLRYLSLSDTVRQFRDIMLPQLDLNIEANNLERFHRDFAGDERVSFPHPLRDLTTTRILTETFLTGRPIMEFTGEDTPLYKRNALGELGLEVTLRMMFSNDCTCLLVEALYCFGLCF